MANRSFRRSLICGILCLLFFSFIFVNLVVLLNSIEKRLENSSYPISASINYKHLKTKPIKENSTRNWIFWKKKYKKVRNKHKKKINNKSAVNITIKENEICPSVSPFLGNKLFYLTKNDSVIIDTFLVALICTQRLSNSLNH
jgi:hypothetical protein